MVLDPIPQSLPVHFFGSRPQPPTSPCKGTRLIYSLSLSLFLSLWLFLSFFLSLSFLLFLFLSHTFPFSFEPNHARFHNISLFSVSIFSTLPSHTHTHTTPPLSLSFSLCHSLTHSLTHSLSHSLSCVLSRCFVLFLTLSVSQFPPLSLSIFLSISLPFSLTPPPNPPCTV